MKIIFPCSYYLPETAASLYLTDNIIHACIENGFEVKVYTPTPTRGVPNGTLWKRKESLCDGMLKIRRFHLFHEGNNSISRAFRYLLSELYFVHKCLWSAYDVAFIDSTPPIQGLKNPIINLIRRKPVIYNAQDIFPDSLVGTGLTQKGSLIWKIGTIIEKITYKYANKIIVISEDFRQNLISKGVPKEKLVVVYNWVDQNAVVSIPRENNKLIQKYGLDPQKFYIEYSGNIGLTQNMDLLLEVMDELKSSHSQIGLILIGDGAYRSQVEKIVAEKHLTNVTMLPFQPYEDISHVFSIGDVGLVISKPGVGENSVPSKTWSIMSASRPVLANFDENELKVILEKNRCGIFTKAGDKKAFKDAILQLYKNRESCLEYGKNGRQFIIDNLTREVGAQKYVDIIKSMVK